VTASTLRSPKILGFGEDGAGLTSTALHESESLYTMKVDLLSVDKAYREETLRKWGCAAAEYISALGYPSYAMTRKRRTMQSIQSNYGGVAQAVRKRIDRFLRRPQNAANGSELLLERDTARIVSGNIR